MLKDRSFTEKLRHREGEPGPQTLLLRPRPEPLTHVSLQELLLAFLAQLETVKSLDNSTAHRFVFIPYQLLKILTLLEWG